MLEEGRFVADRYEILAKVGAGGMSDVYKAMDHVLSRAVAIKVLKQEFADDVNFVTKFRTEAQSAASLEHPNIVNIYDVGSEDGIHYIVMEYVEGITLKTYIEKKKQLSYKEAISIAIQVGRGIEAAHNKNIIHRDIKPQNIMISTEGKVKVTDFGIARAATSNTIHSDVMGSVHYSSPEQARNGFVDGKSDIYSLGIVMYEMVTGRVPFDGDTTVAIAIQHLQDEMVSPRNFVPDLPVSLEKIILKCTQKSADRRYVTMGELLNDLKRALTNPNEDFVTFSAPGSVQDKTRIITEKEVEQIKQETAGIQLDRQELPPERNVAKQPLRQEENDDDEEEEGGILNPKMEKAMTIMGIVAAVVILFIVIYLIGNMLGIFRFGPSKNKGKDVESITTSDSGLDQSKDSDAASDTEDDEEDKVTMISVLGMEVEEAQKKLQKRGLKLYRIGTESSDEYDEGQIISQDIEKGESVAEGTTVKVVVSSGAGEFSAPSVVGNTETAAKGMLTEAGLNPVSNYQYSDKAEGIVISQSPVGESMVKKGDTVTIVVSQGQERVPVPGLRGKTQEQAVAALQEGRLDTGTVESDYDEEVPKGQVIRQTPQEGESVYVGSKVNFVISLGKKEVLYQIQKRIGVPDNDNVISANIQLLDADGHVLDAWRNVGISSFPYTITKRDIEGSSSGTISIEWILEDDEGNITTDIQDEPVSFKQQ